MANEWRFEVSKHSGQPSGLYGTTLFSQLCCDEKRNCWLDHGERQPVVLEDHSVVAHYLLFTTVTLKFLGVLAPYSNSHLDTIYVNEDKLNQSFFFFNCPTYPFAIVINGDPELRDNPSSTFTSTSLWEQVALLQKAQKPRITSNQTRLTLHPKPHSAHS